MNSIAATHGDAASRILNPDAELIAGLRQDLVVVHEVSDGLSGLFAAIGQVAQVLDGTSPR